MRPLDPVYLLAAGVLAPWWLRRRRAGWSARFGMGKSLAPPPAGRRRILLHAVSVGEVNALRRLVPILRREADVIVSTTTDTGLDQAVRLFGENSVVRYPLDLSWSVAKFLNRVKPDAVALAELELWPNFATACNRRGIPLCVINGRLSQRSAKGYARARWIMRPAFASLAFAAVQDGDYAARFEANGVAPGSCLITGTMKWDVAERGAEAHTLRAQADAIASALGIDRRRPLIVAGSTGPGEEAIIHSATPEGAQLMCAPRHPRRFDEAADALPGCVRRSIGGGDPSSGRFLLDTIGELGAAYMLADVVVIGRSFVDLGGSDPIEPASLGAPVVIGPHVTNFRTVVDELEQAGGLRVTTEASLRMALAELLASPDARASLVSGAASLIRQRIGASARHAELILDLAGVVPAPTGTDL